MAALSVAFVWEVRAVVAAVGVEAGSPASPISLSILCSESRRASQSLAESFRKSEELLPVLGERSSTLLRWPTSEVQRLRHPCSTSGLFPCECESNESFTYP